MPEPWAFSNTVASLVSKWPETPSSIDKYCGTPVFVIVWALLMRRAANGTWNP
jgi:hypothetical protein